MSSVWLLLVMSLGSPTWTPVARFESWTACQAAKVEALRWTDTAVCLPAHPDVPPAHPRAIPSR